MICHDTSGKEVVLGAGGFGTACPNLASPN